MTDYDDGSNDSVDFLTEHPEVESSLFMSWVMTCFEWEKTYPTPEELDQIRKNFYPGKAPRTAVDEILRQRK